MPSGSLLFDRSLTKTTTALCMYAPSPPLSQHHLKVTNHCCTYRRIPYARPPTPPLPPIPRQPLPLHRQVLCWERIGARFRRFRRCFRRGHRPVDRSAPTGIAPRFVETALAFNLPRVFRVLRYMVYRDGCSSASYLDYRQPLYSPQAC